MMGRIINYFYYKSQYFIIIPLFIIDFIKFEYFRKNKKNINYYATMSRYGQFLSGTYLFYIQSKKNKSIIYVRNKKYYKTLKKVFIDKNIFLTKNHLLYKYVRFKYINKFSEFFLTNYHANEVIPKFVNLEKIHVQNINTTYFKKLVSKIKGKKVILIALKEKSYYENNKFFKTYLQPDYEFDEFDRIIELVKYYCDNGYFIIRLGSNYHKTNFTHQNFSDYASSKFQNLENDILISNICDLVISNQTGIDILPNLWFKKPLIHFTIRSYRFILDWPEIYVCPMLIYNNHKLLDIKQQMEIESKLWSKYSNQNELYKEYSNSNYTLKKRDPKDIILIVNNFINNNLSFDKDLWYNWHQYNDQFYTFLKRETPTHHFTKMIKLDS